MNSNRITTGTTTEKADNTGAGTTNHFFAKAKSVTKPVYTPSKVEKWFEKILAKIDKASDKALEIATPLGIALRRILATIIIAGIGINIAAEFWPELKSEIPYIYGFFDGMLNGVEWLFHSIADFFQKHFIK